MRYYESLMEKAASLPSWERGLKQSASHTCKRSAESLPSWERGLKLRNTLMAENADGRSPRGSVD